ncbi:hypothetical protein H0H81_001215 [Sphagnurus paluster]|uniref:Zinc-finger domain-containing protein n=1 Tax=Sphagnurus paluster TaxID=117069 RepID=A0A9P7FTS4_9AGAR|nr:hypothetical protein H0H81_001215 [Sphagnurus paluster]
MYPQKPNSQANTSADEFSPSDDQTPPPSNDLKPNMLFTPPLGTSYDELFTSPIPTSVSERKLPVSFFVSHIDIPPLPKGVTRETYRRLQKKPQFTLREVKNQRVPPINLPTHLNLGDALQAAINNNGAIKTVSHQRDQMDKASKSSALTSSNHISNKAGKNRGQKSFLNEFGVADVSKKAKSDHHREPLARRMSVNSSISAPTGSASRNSAPSALAPTQHPDPGDAYTTYNMEKDIVQLIIPGIPDCSYHILSSNTRFVQRTYEELISRRVVRTASHHRLWEEVPVSEGRRFVTELPPPTRNSLHGVEDKLTTGGWLDLLWEEEEDSEEEQEDDDEIEYLGAVDPRQSVHQSFTARREKSAGHSKIPNMPKPTIHIEDSASEDELPSEWPSSKPQPRSSMGYRRVQHGSKGRRPRDEDEYRPSQKALGKQRAVSPDIYMVHSQPLPPSSTAQLSMPLNGTRSEDLKSQVSLNPVAPPLVQPLTDHSALATHMITPNLGSSSSHVLSHSVGYPSVPQVTIDTPSRSMPTPATTVGPTSLLFTLDPPPSTDPAQHHPIVNHNSAPSPTMSGCSMSISNPSDNFLVHSPQISPFVYHSSALDSTTPFLASYPEIDSPAKLYSSTLQLDQPGREITEPTPAADGFLLESEHVPWMGHSPEDMPGLVNGTIDPSLLGGSPVDDETVTQPLVSYESSSPSPPPPTPSYLQSLVAYGSNSTSRAPSSAPSSRSSSTSRAPSPGLIYPFHSSDSAGPSHTGSNYTGERTPKRSRQRRSISNGVASTSNLYLSGSSSDQGASTQRDKSSSKADTSRGGKKSSRGRPQDSDDASGESNSEIEMPHKMKTKRTVAADWLQDDAPGYCHQCRYKNTILKVTCACSKRFCVRCLHTRCVPYHDLVQLSLTLRHFRYPKELAHDPSNPDFTCPVCKNYCTCDVCTTKRGEVYVRVRHHKAKGEPSTIPSKRKKFGKKTPQNPERPHLAGKTNLVAPSFVMPAGPTTYWATMYALNGDRLGPALVGNDGNEEVVVLQSSGRPNHTRNHKRKRIFIGEVQDIWGLEDRCLVRDVNPVSHHDKNNGPNERIYIGNKKLLAKTTPIDRRRRGTHVYIDHNRNYTQTYVAYDGHGFSSPLSSLEDTDGVDAGEGELLGHPNTEADFDTVVQGDLDCFLAKGPGSGFSEDSLADTDVARAISLGLLACGVSVKLSSC